MSKQNVVLLAGGVGGAKLAEGLAALNKRVNLTVIGNVADDDEFHGLWVSPDIDTLTYSLADLIDRDKGWGLKEDPCNALSMLTSLGQDTWMNLGDKDFGLHIFRTLKRLKGERPQVIAAEIGRSLGVDATLVLPTDDVIQTRVKTAQGWISFQEYFVRERCQPTVLALEIAGIDKAQPTPESLAAIAEADVIVIAPSNPLVSINPILSVVGIREALQMRKVPAVAVSPFIGGKTVKGPADKMMQAMGFDPSGPGVATYYDGLIDALLIDSGDSQESEALEALGIMVGTADTLMQSLADKAQVAESVIDLAERCDFTLSPENLSSGERALA